MMTIIKITDNKNIGEDVERLESTNIAGESINGMIWKTVSQLHGRLTIELPYDHAGKGKTLGIENRLVVSEVGNTGSSCL